MHPIVNDFIHTGDRLHVILEKHLDKNQYLEMVFLEVARGMLILDIDPALYLKIDQAIIKGHPDTSVYQLFLSLVIITTSTRHKTERAKAIKSIGDSFSKESFHPVVQSYYVLAMATLKIAEGKTDEYLSLSKLSLDLVGKKSPRYYHILLNLTGILSVEGRLNDIDKDDIDLLNSVPSKDEAYDLVWTEIKLNHSIVTGKYEEGLILWKEYSTRFPKAQPFFIDGKRNTLKILSGDFDAKSYEEELYQLFARAYHSLVKGDFENALKYHFLAFDGNWKNVHTLMFERYLRLHIELSMKNKGMARFLYQEMLEKGRPNYLDDFFLARIQLLEMNQVGANETFRRLIKNVKHFGAMKRLMFELQFAKEMKPTDILKLMSEINLIDDLKSIKSNQVISDFSVHEEYGIKSLIGESEAISQVKKLVKKFAKLKEPVLITGETGTGKELVSRAIHEEGDNPKAPFLAINCGALSEALLQSELFGYVAGAFTGAQKERKGIFETAGKGTVFLDEFGDISPKMQVSLLRVLESNEIRLIGEATSRQIECKIVIATNIDLHQAVVEKKFREDLYFRLTRFDIQLPSLRNRKEDIPSLINYFLHNTKNQTGRPKNLSDNLIKKLKEYSWPGNIRELKNEIERLKILTSDKILLDVEDFDYTRLPGIKLPNKEPISFITAPKLIKKERIFDERILEIVQKRSKIEERLDFLKELFIQFKKLTKMQIIEIMVVSSLTATRDLNTLCETGFIKKISPTKSVRSNYYVIVEGNRNSQLP